VKKKAVIRGRKVHDVGYRPLLLGIAESFEIERFSADNVFIDGMEAVQVLVESDEPQVKAFLEMVGEKKPEDADVEKVDVDEYDGVVMKTESYYRYLTSMQLSKMATYGGRMIEKQGETTGEVSGLRGEFKDYREEFRDYRQGFNRFVKRTDQNFKMISDKYGEISEKMTVILETLAKESRETRETLNETMKLLKTALETLAKSRKQL